MKKIGSWLFAVMSLLARPAFADIRPGEAEPPVAQPVDARTLDNIKEMFRQLIDAENRHDLVAVRPFVWESPSTLFVAKTATPAEGNWAGFWGADVVMSHFHDLYQGAFRMEPDYSREKLVGLTSDVVELYVPLSISVSYAGQTGIAKPFLIVMDWIRTKQGWKTATDIAIPVPAAPAAAQPVSLPRDWTGWDGR